MGVHLDDIKENVAYVSTRSDESLSKNIAVFILYSVAVIFLGLLVLFLVNERYFKNSMEKLESEVNLDLLTGASSRRSGERIMSLYFEKYQISGSGPVLLMFDIDNFKSVNDTKGHVFGDQVLIRVAEILTETVRGQDMAGRYGGEEFLVLLPGADEEAPKSIAERIRKNVEEYAFEEEYHITLSGGVSSYQGESISDFIQQADSRLYEAKRSGKNKVI